MGSVNVQSQHVAVLSGVDHSSTLRTHRHRRLGRFYKGLPDEAKLDRQLKIRWDSRLG